MILLKHNEDLNGYLEKIRNSGNTIGFVPTMGALHNGHISLIINSKNNNTITVCSIFVNPTQFNNANDFEKYPVTLEKDIDVLEKNGCDILFLPLVNEIYPDGYDKLPHYQLGFLETVLEGKYRPGHFQGVCQVVHRLLVMVKPHQLYLGQKDYQQCMVITKLVEIENLKVNINVCATLRENDGLAMSSRNMRLNAAERKKAVYISETLLFLKKQLKPGYLGDLKQRAVNYLAAENFKVDYVEIADANTLELLEFWDGTQKIVALAAAYLNEIRLIDNIPIN